MISSVQYEDCGLFRLWVSSSTSRSFGAWRKHHCTMRGCHSQSSWIPGESMIASSVFWMIIELWSSWLRDTAGIWACDLKIQDMTCLAGSAFLGILEATWAFSADFHPSKPHQPDSSSHKCWRISWQLQVAAWHSVKSLPAKFTRPTACGTK